MLVLPVATGHSHSASTNYTRSSGERVRSHHVVARSGALTSSLGTSRGEGHAIHPHPVHAGLVRFVQELVDQRDCLFDCLAMQIDFVRRFLHVAAATPRCGPAPDACCSAAGNGDVDRLYISTGRTRIAPLTGTQPHASTHNRRTAAARPTDSDNADRHRDPPLHRRCTTSCSLLLSKAGCVFGQDAGRW